MKKFALSAAMLMAASGPLFAQDPGVYIGVKGGSFKIDAEELDSNDPNGKGFLVGYNLGNGAAIEFEHNKSDTFHAGLSGYYGPQVEGEIETSALYFAYRSQGTVFFKVKGGILKEDVTAEAYGDSADESDTGLSVGAGFGFNLGDVAQIEAEYTIIEEDVGYLSLGLNLRF
ncbi:outer membrane beta-barrel protein [Ketobacter sp.]|uniref:outer membrane beta-barrel protein n=1 Tax=Ketobacter sp. TaxID=2083498 RepID=UPI000F2269DD|nr:outer membrane beta-barrel protein [Ketobacter sp.]RLU01289.1 MAG: porin family protein [Ketobacter sp.]